MVKRTQQYTFFEEMQLRIGLVDISTYGQEMLGQENLYVGCIGTAVNVRDHFFNLKTPVSGRYLTLQTLASKYFCMDEVYVFK